MSFEPTPSVFQLFQYVYLVERTNNPEWLGERSCSDCGDLVDRDWFVDQPKTYYTILATYDFDEAMSYLYKDDVADRVRVTYLTHPRHPSVIIKRNTLYELYVEGSVHTIEARAQDSMVSRWNNSRIGGVD